MKEIKNKNNKIIGVELNEKESHKLLNLDKKSKERQQKILRDSKKGHVLDLGNGIRLVGNVSFKNNKKEEINTEWLKKYLK